MYIVEMIVLSSFIILSNWIIQVYIYQVNSELNLCFKFNN